VPGKPGNVRELVNSQGNVRAFQSVWRVVTLFLFLLTGGQRSLFAAAEVGEVVSET